MYGRTPLAGIPLPGLLKSGAFVQERGMVSVPQLSEGHSHSTAVLSGENRLALYYITRDLKILTLHAILRKF